MKARILYVPHFIEAESDRFAAVVADWAEVASFDVPAEAPVEAAHARLDELGWDECVLVADGYAQGLGTEIALSRPDRCLAVAVGHAAKRYTTCSRSTKTASYGPTRASKMPSLPSLTHGWSGAARSRRSIPSSGKPCETSSKLRSTR
jgi:pimeloyl-ACP methyl ester carboxylesterase